MDNHETHISLETIELAKDSGVTIVTFPPHCSHKLQPLDRTTYSAFKRYYNTACDTWMMNHPGKPLTIYDLAGVVGEAYPKAFTPSVIQSGFRVSGCYPTNRDIFTDDEYLTSFVTDRPQISQQQLPDDQLGLQLLDNYPQVLDDQPATGSESLLCSPATTSNNAEVEHETCLTPEMIRPYPKAGERKAGVRRRSGKSRILTDTPEKLALMPDLLRKNSRPNQKCRSEKKSMANKKQRNREGKKATPATNKNLLGSL
jgi:hypothetical protein